MTNEEQRQPGYQSPPKASRFKTGKSGNPGGRPKGARGFKTELLEELAELTMVKDQANSVICSKQRAVIKRLVSLAMEGSPQAMTTIVTFCTREPETTDDEMSDSDKAILEKRQSRMVATQTSGAIGSEPAPED